jgi:hypothetical protein
LAISTGKRGRQTSQILQREDDEHDLQRACCLELGPAAIFAARHIAAIVHGLFGVAR